MRRLFKVFFKSSQLVAMWEGGGRQHLSDLAKHDPIASELWVLVEDIVAIYRKRPGWKNL